MLRKTVSLMIVLTFLLIGMFTLVLNSKPVKSYSETWNVDAHKASSISKVQNAPTTITEIEPSDLSRFSRNPTYRLTIKSLFEKSADSESYGNFRLPYEATLDLGEYPPGTYIFSVNIFSTKGQVGIKSKKIKFR